VIEVGSWEGRSALFFMNYLPRSKLVCIDTFESSEEHRAHPEAFANDLHEIERRFDANLAPFASRLEKCKARSAVALAEYGIDGRRFDIAYAVILRRCVRRRRARLVDAGARRDHDLRRLLMGIPAPAAQQSEARH
jgi:hypothetical protein